MEIVFLLLPLVNFLWSGLLNRKGESHQNALFTIMLMVIHLFLATVIFQKTLHLQETKVVTLGYWVQIMDLEIPWTFTFSHITGVMYLLVSGVSTLVHLYSFSYMDKDERLSVYMGYLSLFTFAMLLLVSGDNLLQVFFGWEGVGFCSYLLIGFWYTKPSAASAAIKAFLMNRVGDIGLIIAMGLLYDTFKTLSISSIQEQIHTIHNYTLPFCSYPLPFAELCSFMLLLAAMGKSAQIGLHTWLPDAMEGPTPVSALIHAATMVTAGVFLLVRMHMLVSCAPIMQETTIWVGLITSLFTGCVATVQHDIKKVIAYSTCSQLGLMMIAVGAGAFHIALFHIFIHGFFKALLFLGAGAVIHGLSGEQDMRQMGGLYKVLPFTYSMMFIGSAAILGVPGLSGYYSKEAIYMALCTHAAEHQYPVLMIAFCVIVALTTLYTMRMIFMTFHGTCRAHETVLSHVHEPPFSMFASMIVLSVASLFGGYLAYEYFCDPQSLLVQSFHYGHMETTHLSHILHNLPTLVVGSMVCVSFLLLWAKPGWGKALVYRARWIYVFLSHKGYFDTLYDELFVRGVQRVGVFLRTQIDVHFVESVLIGRTLQTIQGIGNAFKRRHTGLLTDYLMFIVIALCGGLCLVAIWLGVKGHV